MDPFFTGNNNTLFSYLPTTNSSGLASLSFSTNNTVGPSLFPSSTPSSGFDFTLPPSQYVTPLSFNLPSSSTSFGPTVPDFTKSNNALLGGIDFSGFDTKTVHPNNSTSSSGLNHGLDLSMFATTTSSSSSLASSHHSFAGLDFGGLPSSKTPSVGVPTSISNPTTTGGSFSPDDDWGNFSSLSVTTPTTSPTLPTNPTNVHAPLHPGPVLSPALPKMATVPSAAFPTNTHAPLHTESKSVDDWADFDHYRSSMVPTEPIVVESSVKFDLGLLDDKNKKPRPTTTAGGLFDPTEVPSSTVHTTVPPPTIVDLFSKKPEEKNSAPYTPAGPSVASGAYVSSGTYAPPGASVVSGPSVPIPPVTVTPTPPALVALGSFLEADAKGDVPKTNPNPKVPTVTVPSTGKSTSLRTSGVVQPAHGRTESKSDGGIFNKVKGALESISPFSVPQPTTTKQPTDPPLPPGGSGGPPPQLQLEVDWIKECLIQNIVDNPRNEGGVLQKTISFRICSKTKLPHFQQEMFAVRRTNTDFEWFRGQLVAEFPYLLVPLVPEKKGALEELVGSDEGLHQLSRQYQGFLARVTRHPSLARSQSIKLFLEEPAEDYRERRKADESNRSPTSSLFSASLSTPKDTGMVKLMTELQELERILRQLQEYAYTVKTTHKELTTGYDKWAKELSKLNNTQSLRNPISNFQSDPKFIPKIVKFTNTSIAVAKSMEAQSNTHEAILYERVKEWVRYTKAATELVERQGEITEKYNHAQNDLDTKKSKLETQLGKSKVGQSSADLAKIQKIQAEVILAQEEQEKTRETYEKMKTEFWPEMNRFDRFKSLEISHWMDLYSQIQLKELSTSFKIWNSFVKDNT